MNSSLGKWTSPIKIGTLIRIFTRAFQLSSVGCSWESWIRKARAHTHITDTCDIPWGNATPSQSSNKCSRSGSVKSGLQAHFQLTTYYPIAFHPYFHKGPCYTFPSDLPHCPKCPWQKMSVWCFSLSLAARRWKMFFVNRNPCCCNFRPLGQNRGWQA